MLELRRLDFGFAKARPILDGVSLALGQGEILGLSGPSGTGKSTLGRIVAGYLKPQKGEVLLDGTAPSAGHRGIQYIHQSSIFAVNPRWRLGRIIAEAWQPDDLTLDAIGVSRSWFDRYPHEISGGELQRVVLVRALGPETRFLVADEVSAMLDPITQVEIWSFLTERSRQGLGILAISHDAALLKRVSSRQLVLAKGQLRPVEG
ncbi:ABC transporter ATP-binding protein [Peteryoungia ipomoeae]|uniref:ATP-binding cassette domain-containing protein n=1 Tax=Peteryoungia ipomoeae TaxID=1210932 RepID=A0A4S8P256_9HYPH|nr:ATP-binding cassette domain-containing protein [Peteryoungia ipomoeae]THV23365.1 ATP-binding cassette domain-containing protein [Peteryoungia ipomoeae]